jgi:hypothetical protein
MMQAKNSKTKPPDFNFYSKQIKPEMQEMSPLLYKTYINELQLQYSAYGVGERCNKAD